MRFSLTLLAVIASAVAVFASPAAENSGMHLCLHVLHVLPKLTMDLFLEGGIYKRGTHLSPFKPLARRPPACPSPLTSPLSSLGGPEICTSNLDGSGETDEQVTKDCCAAVNQQAYFNEAEKQCQPYGGHLGNSVDTGAMVQCCSSRGRGSKAV